ncbi:hypothetical protein EVAR_96204_1 [Eumeta japonica]|uniref:Uncharacterized protein n=1 Tax=Eumeta variegata TaxID=151549 RepID=A0A4C1VJN5_EUMVA|nr:hypothetical protein EVAR_96204_1 [Eumeta japonica]
MKLFIYFFSWRTPLVRFVSTCAHAGTPHNRRPYSSVSLVARPFLLFPSGVLMGREGRDDVSSFAGQGHDARRAGAGDAGPPLSTPFRTAALSDSRNFTKTTLPTMLSSFRDRSVRNDHYSSIF